MEVALWTAEHVYHHRQDAPDKQQVQPGLLHGAHVPRPCTALRCHKRASTWL